MSDYAHCANPTYGRIGGRGVSPRDYDLKIEEGGAIVLQFGNGILDVIKR